MNVFCWLNLSLLLLLLILLLEGGKVEGFTNAASQLLPWANILTLVPGQEANPGLDVIVQLECNIFLFSDPAAGVGDLVLGLLVSELEQAAMNIKDQSRNSKRNQRAEFAIERETHRLGSIVLPSALRLSFFMATGPMFCRWSALGLVMIESQMTASLVALPGPGHSAVT